MTGLSPYITAVAVVRHGVQRLVFADGLAEEVDVLDRMREPVFASATTEGGLAAAVVDEESGTVTWPRGADLVPDLPYERARGRARNRRPSARSRR
jgi:hypothetical protein